MKNLNNLISNLKKDIQEILNSEEGISNATRENIISIVSILETDIELIQFAQLEYKVDEALKEKKLSPESIRALKAIFILVDILRVKSNKQIEQKKSSTTNIANWFIKYLLGNDGD